ncbi:MAG: cysteine synthase A [Nitratiruptor sp.]|nr:cysteine synthase A [Nitratiruptor sp.]NPA83771.1 cysteine synthase A [Campylobacterota bacterium]
MVATTITQLIGNTPILQIEPTIWAKCEFLNPGGSIKDRIAYGMIREALETGRITKDTPLVEPTSGNTGIGLAMVAASLGMKLTLTMPESMSIERRKLLEFLGAKVILTPGAQGMAGAVRKARELVEQGYFMLDQFSNPANPRTHQETTAQEILQALPVDIFVAGVGTGGSIMGIGAPLRQRGVRIVAVEPKRSAVLSGHPPGSHKIQGIGAGFIPPILDLSLLDEIIPIEDEEAMETSRQLAREHGVLVGISSGANLAAARKLAQRYPDHRILTLFPDGAERYLSTELFG